MKTKNYTAALMVNSILLILCGFWDLVWKYMRTAYKIANAAHDMTSQSFDYTSVENWTGLLGTGSAAGTVHSIFASLALYLQFVGGTVGLIYAVIAISKHIPKGSGLPFAFGIIIDITGGISVISLFCSRLYPIGFTQMSIIFSLFIIPIVFTVYAKKFSKNIKEH